MKKSKSPHSPVSTIVDELRRNGQTQRKDGPSSVLNTRRAQWSASLNRAGTMMAAMDRDAPEVEPTLTEKLFHALTFSKPKPRRNWTFWKATANEGLGQRRIEQLLKSASKDGKFLKLEDALATMGEKQNEDLHCTLPEGASDPVCEPRR